MTNLAHAVAVTAENFQSAVIEASQQQPVLLEIWAEGFEECDQQQAVLATLVEAYKGKFTLTRLNAAESDPRVQQLAQSLMMQLQLRTVPALVFLSQGQPVKVLQGLQPEQVLRPVLDELTMSPVERVQLQIEELIEQGQHDQALQLLQQILTEEPDNHALQVLQVNLLLHLGRIDDGKTLLASLPDDAPGINQPKAKISFYEMAAELPALAEIEQALAAKPGDLDLTYQRAIRLVLADRVEESLELLLTIMRTDREFREDGARLLMLKLFDYLGKSHELAALYRRRLFSLLH